MSFKNVVTKETMSVTSPMTFSIVSTLFVLCSTQDIGGAVYINHESVDARFLFTSFDQCSAQGGRGGAMVVIGVRNIHLARTCLINNRASILNSLLMWSDHKKTHNSSFNFSSQTTDQLANHPTGLGGLEFYGHSINISNSHTDQCASALFCLYTPAREVYSFVIIANGKGPGIWQMESYNSSIISNSLAINNTVTSGAGYIALLSNVDISFHSCVFINNGIHPMISFTRTGVPTNSVTFRDCAFDFTPTQESLVTIINTVALFNPISQNLQLDVCFPHTAKFTSSIQPYFKSFVTFFIFFSLD